MANTRVSEASGIITVTRDDEVVVSAATVTDLAVAAHGLGPRDPLLLATGDSVQIELSSSDRLVLLPEFAPVEQVADDLDDLLADGHGDAAFDDPMTDAALTLDGAPWAWTRSLDHWQLVPHETVRRVAQMSWWMSESMTGETAISGIYRIGLSTAVCWLWSDIDGTQWEPIVYEVRDWRSLLLEAADEVSPEWDAVCPVCDPDTSGWQITLDIDTLFTTDDVASVIVSIWRPCEEHAGSDLVLADVNGNDWSWSLGRWTCAAARG